MSRITKFDLFPDLPSELRIKVWQYALSEPRVVTMKCERSYINNDARYPKSFTPSHPPPAILYACKESRFEALQVYKPYFKTDRSSNVTYLSFTIDTIRLEDGALDYLEQMKIEFCGIQKMMVDVKDSVYFTHFHMETLTLMTGLKELELVIRQSVVISWDRRNFTERLQWEFEEAKISHPSWECPAVTITNAVNGEQLGVIGSGKAVIIDDDNVELQLEHLQIN